jgi:hypothetical protein
LAGILKINQKTKANVFELAKFYSKIESAMFSAENSLYHKSLKSLKGFANGFYNIPIFEELSSKDKQLVKAIYKNNKNLESNNPEDIYQYITEVLYNSKRIIVLDLDNPKKTKEVSLLGGGFDFRYFMQESNSTFKNEYKSKAIDYYNLFKNTINIFDIIDKSPHFKAMISSLAVTHNILDKTSFKYNFLFSVLKNIVRDNDVKKGNLNIKRFLKNDSFPVKVEEYHLRKLITTVDKLVINK